MTDHITRLLRLIDSGRIKSTRGGAKLMGISLSTFCRILAEAREAGAVIQVNPRGNYAKLKPWRVAKRPKKVLDKSDMP